MKRSLLFALLMLSAVAARTAPPEVTDVVAVQRTDGSGLVDVTYHAADADGDTLYVTLLASDDDGLTWSLPCRSFQGDAGDGVPSLPDRAAVWDFAADNPGLEFDDCRVRVIASDNRVPWHSHSPVRPIVHAWESVDWDDEKRLEEMARSEIVILTSNFVFGVPHLQIPGLLDRIRRHNPDCKILAYVLAKNTDTRWENTSNAFAQEHYDAVRPFWSYTTAGDTLQDWDNRAVVNLLNPTCRQAIVDVYVRWLKTSMHRFDGVFWDYFNNAIWIPDWLSVVGEPDLDGDGIPMEDDPDEIEGYRNACTEMVTAVQDSMGPGFIQIFNGQRAYADSAFAALGDGMNYELFPDVFFQPVGGAIKALDFDYEYNLFRTANWPRSDNGGPYVIVENITKNYYFSPIDQQYHEIVTGKILRVISLLADLDPVFGGHNYGWPVNPIALGTALGPAVETANGLRREFRYGDVELVWRGGSMPTPFDYVIRHNGVIVEEMNIPYEYPLTPETFGP